VAGAVALSGLFIVLKFLVLIPVFVISYYYICQYVLLVRSKSVKSIQINNTDTLEECYLSFVDGSNEKVSLSSSTVFSTWALFLVFQSEDKFKHKVCVRRRKHHSESYDALYVYLSRMWAKQK